MKSQRFSEHVLLDELVTCVRQMGYEVTDLKNVLSIAFKAHDGQVREPAGSSANPVPYITHPVGVAKLAVQFFKENSLEDSITDIVHAALLHDVLEDTSIEVSDVTGIV